MKQLTFTYYLFPVLAVLMATVGYYMITYQLIEVIDPLSTLGQAIQYFCIVDVLVTVPFGLWWHKRYCQKTLSKMDDKEEQARLYEKSATGRIALVSNTMVFAILAYYLLGGYKSMMWVAAISAIGWIFSKPTERKQYLELINEDDAI